MPGMCRNYYGHGRDTIFAFLTVHRIPIFADLSEVLFQFAAAAEGVRRNLHKSLSGEHSMKLFLG